MSRALDTDLFQAVCQVIEKEGEDEKLIEKLKKYCITIPEEFNNILSLEFFNGFRCSISYKEDYFCLLLDYEDNYYIGESCLTKMSSDRIYYYLNSFINVALYGR